MFFVVSWSYIPLAMAHDWMSRSQWGSPNHNSEYGLEAEPISLCFSWGDTLIQYPME